MKIRPIIFSTEMVEAILDDRKTQTRRIVKHNANSEFQSLGTSKQLIHFYDHSYDHKGGDGGHEYIKSPYGGPGDILYVRETWRKVHHYGFEDILIQYKSDNSTNAHLTLDDEDLAQLIPGTKWKPSIHMPKAAARIWLKVKDVRVERLQNISEEDAKAEGIYRLKPFHYKNYLTGSFELTFPKSSFHSLWDSINAERCPWKSNPWVWVVEFKVLSVTGAPVWVQREMEVVS